MLSFTWLLTLGVCLVGPVWSSQLESSMSADYQQTGNSFRFMGITKTMATTTTVVTTQTVYVHPMCYSVVPNVKPCSLTPPTTTPAPTTPSKPSTTPTPTTTTTSKPWIQIIPGTSRPVLTGIVTINKVGAPQLQLPFLQNLGGNTTTTNTNGTSNPGSGLAGLFKKPSINVNVAGSVSASVSSGAGRRRRSRSVEESIQPTQVRSMDMTVSSELSLRESIRQDVAVEASLDDDYHEYELVGLTANDFTDRAMNIFNKHLTIIRLNKVTVTSSVLTTSVYPVVNPSDRVTIAYYGCIPKDAPTTLPSC